MTPQEHTQRIIDDICARTGITRERLLCQPDPSQYGDEHYRKLIIPARSELAWRLRHEMIRPVLFKTIGWLMNCTERTAINMHDRWRDAKELGAVKRKRGIELLEQQAIIAAIKAGRPRHVIAREFGRSLVTVKRIEKVAA